MTAKQQEPEPAAAEDETPEVKEEQQQESEQSSPPTQSEEPKEESQPEEQPSPPAQAEEPKEESQPEEQKPEAEDQQTADTAQSEEKPKEEESATTIQEEASPPTGENVTEQKEGTTTTTTTTIEQEQPPPKEESAEVKEMAAAEPQPQPEEEVKEKPKRPLRNKVRSTIPTEGVDLAMGDGPLEGAEPITFGQQFKQTLEKYADVAALKWKVQEGEGEEAKMVWKTATFAEYYKSCIDAAKSLLKVRHDRNYRIIYTVLLSLFMHQWRHNIIVHVHVYIRIDAVMF